MTKNEIVRKMELIVQEHNKTPWWRVFRRSGLRMELEIWWRCIPYADFEDMIGDNEFDTIIIK